MSSLGELRRSQAVSTYGPGALIPVEEHSYMIVGLDSWEVDDLTLQLREPRLERFLGVESFRLPPSSDKDWNGHDIPVVRFPKMYSCSKCNHLGLYKDIASIDGSCASCASRLVTSRFVVVCESGHISDFPYHRWAHRAKQQPGGPEHQLTLVAQGRSAALSDIRIVCSCGASNDMGGALGKNALKGVIACSANQPWLRGHARENCDLQPRGVQRGASNVWQPLTESTISIPPWSEEASRVVDQFWSMAKDIPADNRKGAFAGVIANLGLKVGIDEIMAVVDERLRIAAAASPSAMELREQENDALRRGRPDLGRGQDFVCIPPEPSETIPSAIVDVHLVTRLREVRALTGFYRLNPPLPGEQPAPLSGQGLRWLPAIEVSGEGIYLGLDMDRLAEWERHPAVVERIALLGGPTDSSGLPLPQARVPSARRVLVHTLAHILIDQWSLDCGYPAASLRERLYIGPGMAGMLIYTATSDSAGSLGGVVGMAKGGKLANSVREALVRAAWCSNDPLCMESGATGVDARNLGACHACALLPETSCELGNTLLDRGLLVGTVDGCPGFLAHLLEG